MTSSGPAVYLLDGVRSAIASPHKGLKNLAVVPLGALVVSEIVRRNKIKKEHVEQIYWGNTVSAGTGQNVARQTAFRSGLTATPLACTVNTVCGSGLQAVILASQAIRCGDARLAVAGGAESVTFAPYLLLRSGQEAFKADTKIESAVYDGLWCFLTEKHMGEICENIAKVQNISREAQDLYAIESHRRACAAIEAGKFEKEIVPIAVSAQKVLARDERPRATMSPEALAQYPLAFRKDGTITAGNASIPCDGAAALLAASGDWLKQEGREPLAKILGYATVAVDPAVTFTAGVKAVQECLLRCRLTIKDIDLFEICESFSAQAVLTRDQLGIPAEKMNMTGGDVALGHPLGCAGARILVTLLHALKREKARRGLACVCFGGGGAVALAVENLS